MPLRRIGIGRQPGRSAADLLEDQDLAALQMQYPLRAVTAGVAVGGSRGMGRPELLVGAAFVGGVAVAIVLRRLGRR